MTTKDKVTLSRALLQTVKCSIAAVFARICHAERSEASHKRVQRTEYRYKMAPVSSRRISYPLYPGTILVAASFVPPLLEGVGEALNLRKQFFYISLQAQVWR